MSSSTHRAWGTRAGKVVSAVASVAIAAAALLPAASAFAATNITFSADTLVALTSPAINLTVTSGSTADSFVNNGTNITLVVGAVALTFKAPALQTFVIDGSAQHCLLSGSVNSLTLPANASHVITVLSTSCTNSSSGGSGGGGGGGYVAPPAPTCSITAPAAAASWSAGVVNPITWTSSGSGIDNALLSYSVNGGNTYGFLANVRPNSGTYSWIVPNTATSDAMVKVECRDVSGTDLSTSVSGAFTIVGSTTSPVVPPPTSVTTPVTTPAPQAAPIAVLIHDPSQLDALLAAMSSTRSLSSEANYSALIHSDALQFKVGLTAAQLATITNFVTYGASADTAKLGAGERRALIRDYFETVGRANVSWDDIQRLTTGQKPVGRNLALEQAKVGAVLAIYVKLEGHSPIFSIPKEDIAWNTLMYRIRFPRDLSKERVGILKFESVFKRVPTSPLDWAAVRAWGYELQ